MKFHTSDLFQPAVLWGEHRVTIIGLYYGREEIDVQLERNGAVLRVPDDAVETHKKGGVAA